MATTTTSLCNSGCSTADAVTTTGETETMVYPHQIIDDICLTALRSIVKISTQPRSPRIEISLAQSHEERLQREKQERLGKEKQLKKPTKEIIKKPENLKRKRHSGIKIHDHPSAAAEMAAEEVVVRVQEDDDDDYHHYCSKPTKQPRRKFPKIRMAHGPEPPPDMPSEIRELIASMNGGDPPTLIIQKALYATDLSTGHHRLSMPLRSIRNEFLSPEEKKLYMTRTEKNQVRSVDVKLIDPMMRIRKISFKMWEMTKDEGRKPSSWSYVFGSPWLEVIDDNGLDTNDVLQVWAFRVGSELCFAMVLVAKGDRKEDDGDDDN